jgi:hypothetical protein
LSGDPVSWLLIEPGWKVADAQGGEAGRVAEVSGDAELDIFDGLIVATGLLGRRRYVPSEEVASITEGEVRLAVDRDGLDALEER